MISIHVLCTFMVVCNSNGFLFTIYRLLEFCCILTSTNGCTQHSWLQIEDLSNILLSIRWLHNYVHHCSPRHNPLFSTGDPEHYKQTQVLRQISTLNIESDYKGEVLNSVLPSKSVTPTLQNNTYCVYAGNWPHLKSRNDKKAEKT